MTRPKISRDRVLELIAPHVVSLGEQPVIGVGLRGGLAKSGNRIGGFDDCLIVLTDDLCEAFTGNTDPSTEIPNRANLVVGVHWFKPGLHHPGTPNEYPAFVQDGPIIVKRWQTDDVAAGARDSRGTCIGNGLWTGDFAIHIHDAMGVNTTGSEGCQTVIKTEWPIYHTLQLHELQTRNLRRFPYILVEGAA